MPAQQVVALGFVMLEAAVFLSQQDLQSGLAQQSLPFLEHILASLPLQQFWADCLAFLLQQPLPSLGSQQVAADCLS